MPEPRDRFFDANGLRMHFLEWGEPTARPIILLHGGALTAHTWDVVCLGLQPNRFGSRGAPPPTTAERWADVQRISCPTLVVRGGRSDMFYDEDAAKLAATLPHGRWIKIDNASHTVQGDQPLALLTAIREFLG